MPGHGTDFSIISWELHVMMRYILSSFAVSLDFYAWIEHRTLTLHPWNKYKASDAFIYITI